jgi:hypothetical protein
MFPLIENVFKPASAAVGNPSPNWHVAAHWPRHWDR